MHLGAAAFRCVVMQIWQYQLDPNSCHDRVLDLKVFSCLFFLLLESGEYRWNFLRYDHKRPPSNDIRTTKILSNAAENGNAGKGFFFSLIISRFLSDFDVTPATARQCIRSWIPSQLGGDSNHSFCFSLLSSEEGAVCSVPVLLIVKVVRALLLGPEVSYRLSIVNCREMLSSRGWMYSSSSIKLCPQLSDAT